MQKCLADCFGAKMNGYELRLGRGDVIDSFSDRSDFLPWRRKYADDGDKLKALKAFS